MHYMHTLHTVVFKYMSAAALACEPHRQTCTCAHVCVAAILLKPVSICGPDHFALLVHITIHMSDVVIPTATGRRKYVYLIRHHTAKCDEQCLRPRGWGGGIEELHLHM